MVLKRKRNPNKQSRKKQFISIGNPPVMVRRSYLNHIAHTLSRNRQTPHVYGNEFNDQPINWRTIDHHRRGEGEGMAAELKEATEPDEIYARINQRFNLDIASYVQTLVRTTDTEETLSLIITFLHQQYPNFIINRGIPDREILEQYIRATDEELNCPLPKTKKKSRCSMMGGSKVKISNRLK